MGKAKKEIVLDANYDDSFDEILLDGVASVKKNEIQQMPINKLIPFANHPFKVLDDENMAELVDSIRERGILSPVVVRPKGNLYELISGHRRTHAARAAGLTEIPVVVRDMSDEEATILMVDANIQREEILPSERAHSLKMKIEALNTLYKRGERNGKKNRDLAGEEAGLSGRQVQRYLNLNDLHDILICDPEGEYGPLVHKLKGQMLANAPHYTFGDLAAIFQVQVDATEYGNAVITVKDEHMKMWGVKTEDLMNLAKENMAQNQPVRIQGMMEVLREMMGDVPAEMLPTGEDQMYVMSNETKINGAAAVIFTEKLDEFAKDKNADLFIIPSSIHECIIVPDTGNINAEDLGAMVKDVNSTQVAPDEVLSDNVYFYDREAKTLYITATNEPCVLESDGKDFSSKEKKRADKTSEKAAEKAESGSKSLKDRLADGKERSEGSEHYVAITYLPVREDRVQTIQTARPQMDESFNVQIIYQDDNAKHGNRIMCKKDLSLNETIKIFYLVLVKYETPDTSDWSDITNLVRYFDD